jgi:hypothetical protein
LSVADGEPLVDVVVFALHRWMHHAPLYKIFFFFAPLWRRHNKIRLMLDALKVAVRVSYGDGQVLALWASRQLHSFGFICRPNLPSVSAPQRPSNTPGGWEHVLAWFKPFALFINFVP